MSSRAWLLFPLLLPLGLTACEPSEPPIEFAILNVTPLTQKSHETKTVQVRLNADPVFFVDYGGPEVRQVDAPVLTLGAQSVPLAYRGHGVFEGAVGPMARGNYPVKVRLDGREALFTRTYDVTSLSFNYEFASIPPQVRGQPFTVTLTVTARGLVAGEPIPSRTAVLTVFSGSRAAFTAQLGPFTPGRLQQSIIVDQTGDDFVALLEDSEGEKAFSNAFPVAPPMQ